jgi:hypothetical protein
MKKATGLVSMLAIMASLFACGGGGTSAPSPYTGLTTPAVITDNNADEIALAAFQGGDLGASTGGIISLSMSGESAAAAEKPMPLAVVRLLTDAANAALSDRISANGPVSPAVVTIDNTLSDGQGGTAHYTLSVNDATGVFSGTFVFTNFHGDGGGTVTGTVSVTGAIAEFSLQILFHFQSVQIADVSGTGTANGTVDLVATTGGTSDTGTATLNLFLRDDASLKTLWLSNVVVASTAGAGYSDVALSGRIYLHDYGYVDVATPVPFHYLDAATFPSSGQMTVTGNQDKGVRLTADSQTQYTLDVDSDGDGAYDDLTVTVNW